MRRLKYVRRGEKTPHGSIYAYDENGWPSGFVGGKLLKDKNNCNTYLTIKYGPYDKKSLVDLSNVDYFITGGDEMFEGCAINLTIKVKEELLTQYKSDSKWKNLNIVAS